ncbi:MAG: TrmH family RNA methyltransferase [Terriglobia bacterium]
MKPLELSWRTVLVRPRNPLNIGAAARALANFGLLEMAVVAPFEPTWVEARSSAVGAEAVMARARAVPTLAGAIGETTLVMGTTTGSRRIPHRELLPLPELGSWLRLRQARGEAALLFGAEKTGLSNQDMSYCHALVRIPTTPECPSMNLGQAVAVCAYELARAGIVPARPPRLTTHRSQPANLQTLEHILQRAARVLDVSGYLQPRSRAAMLIKLRHFLLDLNLTSNGARILGGVLSQVEWKLEQKHVDGIR